MNAKPLSLALTAYVLIFLIPLGHHVASTRIAASSPKSGLLPEPQIQRARYRVTLTGFTCQHETVDNLVGADGWGDEVYFDTQVWTIERGRGIVSHTSRRSIQMGDTRTPGQPRVKAGTSSPQGGIKRGDKVPNATPWALSATKVEDDRLPMLLWEGELRQSATGAENGVLILPTLWEWDGVDSVARRWATFENFRYGSMNLNMDVPSQPVVAPRNSFGFHNDLINPGVGADRPIGMFPHHTRHTWTYRPSALFLHYQVAQGAIERPSTTHGVGVIEIKFEEVAGLGDGSYTIYLLIERLSEPKKG